MYSTDSFELMLLSAIVKDNDVFKKLIGLADSQLFSSSMSSEVYEIVKDFFKQYSRTPSQSELIYIYKRDRTVSDDMTITNFLNLIYTQEVDVKFVTNELNRYIKIRRFENLFKISYEKLK